MKLNRRAALQSAFLGAGSLAALYAVGAAPASFAGERTLADSLRALKVGEMAKLQVHDAPRPGLASPVTLENGEQITLDAYKGKVLVVNFWATFCAPCKKEMPSLDRLAGSLDPDQAQVVLISLDRPGPKMSLRTYDQLGIKNLPLHIDSTWTIAKEAKFRPLPTTLLYNRAGQEVARLEWYAEWDYAESRAVVERIIAEPDET